MRSVASFLCALRCNYMNKCVTSQAGTCKRNIMLDKQKEAARQFAETWRGKGDEKRDCQKFWIQLLQEVYGVEHHYQIIDFEVPVKVKHIGYIDGYIHGTKVLIEQKSLGIDLDKAAKQSDGAVLTPYEQAKRYADNVTYSMKPRYIVTCNFAEFRIYDMDEERPEDKMVTIMLEDLPKDFPCMQFLVESGKAQRQKELKVSVDAGRIVGQLYDAFAKQYDDPTSPETMHSLNVLCVRLVFCLYAEDAGVFGAKRDMFHDYLNNFPQKKMNRALAELFDVLNQRPEERSRYVQDDKELSAFPYVNGGLFAGDDLYIPEFTEEICDLLLKRASLGFDWSAISPTIFGAVFESTLNPETRRSGGMHYTSVDNIHKVINPLFMNDLWIEFNKIRSIAVTKKRNSKLIEFQRKLSSLRFLDPACGSGNFLTETYLSLRRLENEALRLRANDGQILMNTDDTTLIAVSLTQFSGIEINEFAVSVAKTALWIAQSQMMAETESIVGKSLDFLPLKTSANIVQGNALRLDWETLVPRTQLSYIMGNPPFVGYAYRTAEQREDLQLIASEMGNNLDYVVGWYFKAAQMMQGTNIRAALVSTNSITQGEQVAAIWKPLYDRFGIHIDFAHRTFRWDSEASLKAHVHCVIVGFSCAPNNKPKIIYDGDRMQEASNINGYLMDAPNVFIESRNKPVSCVTDMAKGSIPVDDGNFFLSDEERLEFIEQEPSSEKFIKRFLGAKEFLHDIKRWCLWLNKATPHELKSMPKVMERVNAVRQFRLLSTKAATRKYADFPTRFMEIRQPESNYLLVPRHSSENRKYIPLGFISPDVICGDANLLIPNATLYHFGVLMSNVHNTWMRAVCGRLEMRYRYSINVVYNNFPWPEPTEEQRARIEETARAILDARAKYPDSSLADLYDEVTMPPELRTAHQRNDRAVCASYGWNASSPEFSSEAACVSTLMRLYQRLTTPSKSDN